MQRTERRKGKMIRARRVRQTAITNSTPPVRDNYRTGREATPVWMHTRSFVRGRTVCAARNERDRARAGRTGKMVGSKLKLLEERKADHFIRRTHDRISWKR